MEEYSWSKATKPEGLPFNNECQKKEEVYCEYTLGFTLLRGPSIGGHAQQTKARWTTKSKEWWGVEGREWPERRKTPTINAYGLLFEWSCFDPTQFSSQLEWFIALQQGWQYLFTRLVI